MAFSRYKYLHTYKGKSIVHYGLTRGGIRL